MRALPSSTLPAVTRNRLITQQLYIRTTVQQFHTGSTSLTPTSIRVTKAREGCTHATSFENHAGRALMSPDLRPGPATAPQRLSGRFLSWQQPESSRMPRDSGPYSGCQANRAIACCYPAATGRRLDAVSIALPRTHCNPPAAMQQLDGPAYSAGVHSSRRGPHTVIDNSPAGRYTGRHRMILRWFPVSLLR